MIQLFKNSLKYKGSNGNMQDSGVLFASEKEKDYATKKELEQLYKEIDDLRNSGSSGNYVDDEGYLVLGSTTTIDSDGYIIL